MRKIPLTGHRLGRSRHLRRGNVFVVVVMILAALALLVLTFSYTAQTESYAARNLSAGIQSRVAAFTGLPDLVPVDDPRIIGAEVAPGQTSADQMPVTINLELSSRFNTASFGPGAPDRSINQPNSNSSFGISRGSRPPQSANASRIQDDLQEDAMLSPIVQGPLGQSLVEDEAAKINVNTLIAVRRSEGKRSGNISNKQIAEASAQEPMPGLSESDFARFIENTLKAKGVHANTSANSLARAITWHRFGPDGRPGRAGFDDNANNGGAQPASDGIDNDGDGRIDNPEEDALGTENDGRDNDYDGRIDEPDESINEDGLDNDFDGTRDEGDEGIDDPDEFASDMRRAPRGDDRPYKSLKDLLAVDGMTAEVLTALAPHLTVFSASRAAYPADETDTRRGYLQIDPNTARPQAIFELLRRNFPTAPEPLLGQFTANLIDRRDADSIPSELSLGDFGQTYVGTELTPYISEVFPDVPSTDQSDGDDGQYVELVNPYTRSMDVNGWRLEGGRAVVRLRGSIPPDGVLVVTDDLNNANDSDPEEEPGVGSFYDVFKKLPIGAGRRVIEERNFDLSDSTGTVRLYDADARLIDVFEYTGGQFTGAKVSFQRMNPRLRGSVRRVFATPLEPNVPTVVFDLDTGERYDSGMELGLREAIERYHDRPFVSPVELMLVATNYSSFESSLTGGFGRPDPTSAEWDWRFPELAVGDQDNLSARLVDLFMPGAPAGVRTRLAAYRARGLTRGNLEFAGTSENELKLRDVFDAPAALFGRINLNTAPAAVIAALPGVDDALAYRISRLRTDWLSQEAGSATRGQNRIRAGDVRRAGQASSWFKALPVTFPKRWRKLSDFMNDEELWSEIAPTPAQRVTALYPFSRLVAFDSLSFKITTKSEPAPGSSPEVRPADVERTERIIAGDRGRIETVSFRMLQRPLPAEKDPDLRFAKKSKSGLNQIKAFTSIRDTRAKRGSRAEPRVIQLNSR